MAISKEQAEEIKKKIFQQIEKQPIENKEQIKQQILLLNEEQLEQFLKQQNLKINEFNEPQKHIFQSIVKNEIPSYKIAENTKSIAILEINPLSKGHLLILPKQQFSAEKIPKSALSLAQKIAKKIKTKLKPEDIKIEISSFQNYAFINIIPIYKDKQLKKYKAEETELKEIQSKLQTKMRKKRVKNIKPPKKFTEINPRIP